MIPSTLSTTLALMLVLGGGLLGGAVRAVLDWRFAPARAGAIPWGIVVCNLAGSAVLGVLLGAAPGSTWTLVIGTGFCGALTTFSTFSLHVVQLARTAVRTAALYLTLSVVGGLALALLGHLLGSTLSKVIM